MKKIILLMLVVSMTLLMSNFVQAATVLNWGEVQEGSFLIPDFVEGNTPGYSFETKDLTTDKAKLQDVLCLTSSLIKIRVSRN